MSKSLIINDDKVSMDTRCSEGVGEEENVVQVFEKNQSLEGEDVMRHEETYLWRGNEEKEGIYFS